MKCRLGDEGKRQGTGVSGSERVLECGSVTAETGSVQGKLGSTSIPRTDNGELDLGTWSLDGAKTSCRESP